MTEVIHLVLAYDEESSWVIEPAFSSHSDAVKEADRLRQLQVKIDAAADKHTQTMLDFYSRPGPGDDALSEEWEAWDLACHETEVASLARFGLTKEEWEKSEAFVKFEIRTIKVQH